MKINILRILVVILACTSAIVLIEGARAQTSPASQEFAASLLSLGIAAPAQTLAVNTAPQEKTLGETHPKIQVLKGLPESELGLVMNFVAVSMGRRCDYCHVNNAGKWDWESDEKEEKLTARKMMTMVLAINKDNFRGNTQVSCFTCHRGRTSPQGSPSFPLPTPAPRPQPQPTPAAGQPAATPLPTPAPPTADQILAKYTDALGGQAAIDKLKTSVMKGTYTGFNGAPLTYEVSLSAPDKFHISVNTPQGTTERGFDSKIGWEKNARGVNVLANEILDQMKSMFLFFRNIKLKEQFAQVRFNGRDKINDRDVLIIGGRTADNHRERLYFDAETGLLVRRLSYADTPIGVIPTQFDFEDYRDVDGVKLPFTMKVSSVEPGFVSTRKYTEIKLNVPVDDATFRMPAKP
jgi:photosynthetic reaction center cytochrome c subunit